MTETCNIHMHGFIRTAVLWHRWYTLKNTHASEMNDYKWIKSSLMWRLAVFLSLFKIISNWILSVFGWKRHFKLSSQGFCTIYWLLFWDKISKRTIKILIILFTQEAWWPSLTVYRLNHWCLFIYEAILGKPPISHLHFDWKELWV